MVYDFTGVFVAVFLAGVFAGIILWNILLIFLPKGEKLTEK